MMFSGPGPYQSNATTMRAKELLKQARLREEAERSRLRRRSHARMVRAADAMYAARNCVWVPELGPCNVAERAFVRRIVAEQITYEAAMAAWFTPLPLPGGAP